MKKLTKNSVKSALEVWNNHSRFRTLVSSSLLSSLNEGAAVGENICINQTATRVKCQLDSLKGVERHIKLSYCIRISMCHHKISILFSLDQREPEEEG